MAVTHHLTPPDQTKVLGVFDTGVCHHAWPGGK